MRKRGSCPVKEISAGGAFWFFYFFVQTTKGNVVRTCGQKYSKACLDASYFFVLYFPPHIIFRILLLLNISATDHGNCMTTVQQHYDTFLAQYYDWIHGGWESRADENRRFFHSRQVVPTGSGRFRPGARPGLRLRLRLRLSGRTARRSGVPGHSRRSEPRITRAAAGAEHGSGYYTRGSRHCILSPAATATLRTVRVYGRYAHASGRA